MSNTEFDSNKLNAYLNSNELAELEYLNEQVNKANESLSNRTDIMNLTLNTIIKNWANVNSLVFSELIIFFSNIRKYSEYIEEENTNSFLIATKHFIEDLFHIFNKNGRLLYIGITLILISLMIYFIGITS